MRTGNYYVYILTNPTYNVLYTGVTNDLACRVGQHRQKQGSQFTRRYIVSKLVYYEYTSDISAAIQREKEIKLLTRAKKTALVETLNPGWVDLLEAFRPPGQILSG